MEEQNISINMGEAVNLEVNLPEKTNCINMDVFYQEEVTLDVDLALMYIKSGQKEIEDYVENVAKPEIDRHVVEEAEPIVTRVVNEIAEPVINNYMETKVKPEINTYTQDKLKDFNLNATNQTNIFNENAQKQKDVIDDKVIIATNKANEASDSAKNALTSELNAKASQLNAKDSETNAKTSENNAKLSEINAEESAKKAASFVIPDPKDQNGKFLSTDGNMLLWKDVATGGLFLKPCTALEFKVEDTGYSMKWTDPADIIVADVNLSAWAGTKIVKKLGDYPRSVSDGEIVLDSKVRNQYQNTWFVDNTAPISGSPYFYKAFPYNTDNVITNRIEDNFLRTPLLCGVNLKEEEFETKLFWTDPVNTNWKGTKIVRKIGSYPENVDDGVVVLDNTVRDKYSTKETAFVDPKVPDTLYFYKAFPYDVEGVVYNEEANKFPEKRWKPIIMYSYTIHQADSNPETRVEYTEDTVGMKPCKMNFDTDTFEWGSWRDAFFIPKPCALRYDGTVAYYLDPNDFTKKADGTPSDVSDSNFGGNFMVEFPQIFVKAENSGDDLIIHVADGKVDDNYECWSCKRADGTYNEHFYLPMFQGTVISGKMRSVGTLHADSNTSDRDEATNAKANGKGWNTTLWCDEVLMWVLFPLLFKSTNSQTALGAGSNTTYANNYTALKKGIMYGTMKSSNASVNFLGMHNWYGCLARRCNGLMLDGGIYKVKMTYSTIDGSTTTGFNLSASGYIDTSITSNLKDNDWITKLTAQGKANLLPLESNGGSKTTYFCDLNYITKYGTEQAIIGGFADGGAGYSGIFTCWLSKKRLADRTDHGASLSFHEGWG